VIICSIDGARFSTAIPAPVTVSGNRPIAPSTSLLTLIAAMSGSVPTSKVTISSMSPSSVDFERMYAMLSTPSTVASIGAATVSATASALAPG